MSSSCILAIESSCDDTSASVIKSNEILSNIIARQLVHEQYGGVVPELASRAHEKHIYQTVAAALSKANIEKGQLDAIAFTQGPGLMGALLVGAHFAKSMAQGLGIPLIGVNHMHAHILAHFIEPPYPQFPFLCLTVSGGHTQIVKVDAPTEMEILGETIDDAVGEAFDKIAKVMGYKYPGGPMIDKMATNGDEKAFAFPKTNVPDLNFSFSGIKTGFLNFLRKGLKEDPNFMTLNEASICASIQLKLVEMLMTKFKKASKDTGIKDLAIAGGVAANSRLRSALRVLEEKGGVRTFVPKFEYCTDNAAMIAQAAHYKYEAGIFAGLDESPSARLKFSPEK